jgi:MFS family permease
LKLPRPVLLVGLATAFSLFGDQTLYSVLPTYYVELGLLPYQVGLLLSVNRGIRLITNHLAERLCRRFNLAWLFGASLGLGAVLTAIYGLSSHFFILLGARMLWGLCWSFIRQISLMTVADSAAKGNIGQLMGFYSGISRMGSIAGNFVGALGHDFLGYTPILLIFALVSTMAIPLGPLSRRKLPHIERAVDRVEPSRKAGWGLLFAGFAVGCVGQGLVMSTMGLVLKDSVGDGITLSGVTIGVATLTGTLMASRWIADLGAPLMGGLSDRVGRRGGATFFFVAGALVLAGATLQGGILWLILAILLYFVFATGATIALVAEAGVRGPRAVASYVTAADFGSFAGPLLGWLMPQLALPIELIFVMGGCLYAVAGCVAFLTFKK